MKLLLERRIWYVIWLYSIVFHLVATPLMYRLWGRVAYKLVYPYMAKCRAEGREFAQPFGEGVEGIMGYLRGTTRQQGY